MRRRRPSDKRHRARTRRPASRPTPRAGAAVQPPRRLPLRRGPRPASRRRIEFVPHLARAYAETGGEQHVEQLRWMVELFAARVTVEGLEPEERATVERGFMGFLRQGVRAREGVPIGVTAETLTRAHVLCRRILTEWLTTGRVVNAPTVGVQVSVLTSPAGRPYVHVELSPDDDAKEAVLRLLFLLGAEGRRVLACQAPAPRSTAPCGRWFVGRSTADYCSRSCYTRAASRRFREKRAPAAYGSRLRAPEPTPAAPAPRTVTCPECGEIVGLRARGTVMQHGPYPNDPAVAQASPLARRWAVLHADRPAAMVYQGGCPMVGLPPAAWRPR
jgi:hypothetical protein